MKRPKKPVAPRRPPTTSVQPVYITIEDGDILESILEQIPEEDRTNAVFDIDCDGDVMIYYTIAVDLDKVRNEYEKKLAQYKKDLAQYEKDYKAWKIDPERLARIAKAKEAERKKAKTDRILRLKKELAELENSD